MKRFMLGTTRINGKRNTRVRSITRERNDYNRQREVLEWYPRQLKRVDEKKTRRQYYKNVGGENNESHKIRTN